MQNAVMLMPFLDESHSFTHGFECGTLWHRLKDGDNFEGHPVHTANVKQIELICACFGVTPEIKKYDEEWSWLTVKSVLDQK